MLVALSLALSAAAMPPQLFMDPGVDGDGDLYQPWGLMQPAPTALVRADNLSIPTENYTAGATVIGAFSTDAPANSYEVFVAVGRPGEPIVAAGTSSTNTDGVAVQRYTTADFVTYAGPTTVLFLPNGPSPGKLGDGNIWTVKSMDRNGTGYLLMAFYGDSCSSFLSPLKLGPGTFVATSKDGSFKDHDDTNLIWSRTTNQWVDMQIFGAPWLLANGSTTICPHNLSDNGGCDGGPRTVTARLSNDGVHFSGDLGCSDPSPDEPVDPTTRKHCNKYNEAQLIRPHPTEDPPEMQFYRIRPFYVGESGRLAAHALQYAASPAEVNNISDYGYWGPYCANAAGGFDMCHKGHGYGRMHGPHMMEEWWVGAAKQKGPEDLAGWQRPFKRFRAAPHDVWLMSQPVVHNDQHVWVSDTGVYALPLYRIAGMYAPANGEFSTHLFAVPAAGLTGLWVNVDAKWRGNLVTGGCDEGCAAYVMAELQDEEGRVIPGYERGKSVLLDRDELRAPIAWTGSPAPLKTGTEVRVRFYFRDATIYAFGL